MAISDDEEFFDVEDDGEEFHDAAESMVPALLNAIAERAARLLSFS